MTSEERRVEFVVFVSKFCNLRCRYCYELPDLGNRARMKLEQIERMFVHVAEYYARHGANQVQFQWFGGEPLVLPPEFYWQVFDLQKAVFRGAPYGVRNVCQTNLTLVDDERLRLLREGFDGVGVSMDVYGDLRVDTAGVCQEAKVLENFARARAAGVWRNRPPGALTVLTKANLARVADTYRFYRDQGIAFRLLPLHQGPFEKGLGFEITAHDTLSALSTLVDLWLADDDAVLVLPVVEYIRDTLRCRMPGAKLRYYDKAEWERLFLVDVDGSLRGYNDPFDGVRTYGNIFEQPLEALLASDAHQQVLREAADRVERACRGCEFHGRSCSGYAMAEGDQEFTERDADGRPRCVAVKGVLRHIELRLQQAGVLDAEGALTETGRAVVARFPPA
jgi:uncharacterized protein